MLEILVAIVIMCLGLLAMESLTVGIMGGNLFSNRLTTATMLAQDQMEEMRRVGYNDLPDTDHTGTEEYGEIEFGYTEFKRVTEIDADYPAAGSRLKMITVTVYWDSDKHSVELKTILSEK